MKKKLSKNANRALIIISVICIAGFIALFKFKNSFAENIKWVAYALMAITAVGAVVCFILADFGDEPDPEIIELTPEEESDFEFLTANGEYDEDSDEDFYCENCGAIKNEEWKYCPQCGKIYDEDTEAEGFCPKCNRPVMNKWKYCPDCGSETGNFGIVQRKPINPDDDIVGICTRCGTGISRNFFFCPGCGIDLTTKRKKCPECGENCDENWDYCTKCGHLFAVEE